MKSIQSLYITFFLWMCFTHSTHAQLTQTNITVQANIHNAGLVSYSVGRVPQNTHVFTLFGDGTFSTLKQPTHVFSTDTIYDTEMYFAKAYDPNIPPRKKLKVKPRIINGVSSTISNPMINMVGDIDLMTSWATAAGFETFYIIAFRNTTSSVPLSGTVEFMYHTSDLQVNTSDIKIHSGWAVPSQNPTPLASSYYDQKISWDYTGLEPDEVRYIYIPATTLRMVGDQLNLEVKITSSNGRETTNQEKFLTRRYPHDPNFKIANKECIKYGIGEQQELIYTVGYFNDGENYAENVFVEDPLSEMLVANSVSLVDYEYAPTTWYERNGTLYFNFKNINLPGTNQSIPRVYSYDQASTYFSFKICTKANLTDCILNQASIVFDSQPIFYTNVSKLCMYGDCTGYDICQNYVLRNQVQSPILQEKPVAPDELIFNVYPNPISNIINFDILFKDEKTTDFTITLQDYSGKILKEFAVNQHDSTIFKNSFSVKNMSSGLYFLTLKTPQGQHTKKIIKH